MRNVIEHIAKVLKLTTYDARLRLRTSLPRSIAFEPTYEQAVELARRLHCDRMFTILYKEANLPPHEPFAAFRMGRAGDGFIFEDKRGQRRTIERSQAAFVVFGRVTTTGVKSELHLTSATYGMQGASIPMRLEKVDKRLSEQSLSIVFFDRDPAVPPVRIISTTFDFQCLGRHIGQSDNVNGLKLMEIVEATWPDVPTDRRLMETKVGETMVPHNRRKCPDVEYAASVMLYWEHLARTHASRFYNAAFAAESQS